MDRLQARIHGSTPLALGFGEGYTSYLRMFLYVISQAIP